jgi:hypothetical protein
LKDLSGTNSVGNCVEQRLGYWPPAMASELEEQVRRVGAPLAGLIRSTRAQLSQPIEPARLT